MNPTSDINDAINKMALLVGDKYIITEPIKMQPYCKGFRFGSGDAFAVVKPATLLEIWNILKLCVDKQFIIIMQAANTGLTGGSTPNGNNYDRPIVIINTMRIKDIQIINDATQIVGLAGSTLFGLEDELSKHGREPHSVIGSSCIGASIVGGVCNNSGGALVQRGPAYTEMALFAQIDQEGNLSLVNNIGIELGSTPEEILTNLQNKNYSKDDVFENDKLASDNVYHERVREIDADSPSRFNNDGRRLYEASGCAGKLAVFAVRVDTYPKPEKYKVFYVGTNDVNTFTQIRRDILSTFKNLPVSGEYLHKDCYDASKKYGKDTFLVINKLGSKFIPKMFSLKRKVDQFTDNLPFFPKKFSELTLQYLSYLWPNHLPKKMEKFRKKYNHHWIIEMNNDGVDEAKNYFNDIFKNNDGDYFECTKSEGEKAILHRFVAGGAIGRMHAVNKKELGDVMTIDVAFPRNEKEWFETLPEELDNKIAVKLYYGHLFCHVMHQNYIMKKGVDAKVVKNKILETFDKRGAEYPAEHNVGHEYMAKEALSNFYKKCDPTNAFNPGIGKTSKKQNWS